MADTYGRSRDRTSAIEPIVEMRRDKTYRYVGDQEEQYSISLKDSEPGSITETMQDTETANFHVRRARGEIINSPLLLQVIENHPATPGAYNQFKHWYGTDTPPTRYGESWVGSWAWPTDLWPSYLSIDMSSLDDDIASLSDKAVTQAFANASSAEMAVLMTAGEGSKTVASIASILGRAVKILRAVRKLDIKYLKRQISYKELEDRYMELRYALRPLMIDAKQTLAALEKSKSLGLSRQTARGFASQTASANDTVPLTGIYETTGTVVRTCKLDVEVRAGVLCDVQTTNDSIFGLDQIAETAWELVPFSFIADWFVNIGDTIAAWMPSAGITHLASWVTVIQTVTQENSLGPLTLTPAPHFTSFGFTWQNQRIKRVSKLVHRSPNPNLSLLPTVSVRLDPLKLLDLTVILRKIATRGRS